MLDALHEHARTVKGDANKRPRRFELHPTVYQELSTDSNSKNYLVQDKDGFIRFMGIMVMVSTDFTEARLISYGNTIMPL